MRKLALVGVLVLGTAEPALAQNTATNKQPDGKTYLQTQGGQALYVFDGDRTTGGTPGAPTCYDQCAGIWPPFVAGPDAQPNGDFNLATRRDGVKQWTLKGRPLYTFVRDTTPGKIEGDGFNGNKWHLARP